MTEVIDQFRGNYRFLSNFWESPVIVPVEMMRVPGFGGIAGASAPTVEHLYQAAKALNVKDVDTILGLPTPKDAKRAGREIKMRKDFDSIKLSVMASLIEFKFTQSELLKEALLDTGDAELIEGNTWGDTYWGIDLRTGVGQNHLGKILKNTRKNIKND